MTDGTEPIVRMPVRVRYHECDPQGVVFNAHYLAYADMASFEAIKKLFGAHSYVLRLGVDMVVAESNVRYHGACRFDEELSVEACVERVGDTSLTLRFEIVRDGELVTEVTNRYVWVDSQTLQPTRPPQEIADAFRGYAAGAQQGASQ